MDRCCVCGGKPTIEGTGMCGPCVFGEADTAGEVFTADEPSRCSVCGSRGNSCKHCPATGEPVG